MTCLGQEQSCSSPLTCTALAHPLVHSGTYQFRPGARSRKFGSRHSAVQHIRWGHKVAGLPSPVDHPTVLAAAEGGRRNLARPVQPKGSINEQTLFKLAGHYNTPGAPLETHRFLFIILIGYAGLFRISEVLSIGVCDIDFHESYMSIFVPIRKNDQHRDGHTSVLAKSDKIAFPVSITERLVGLLPSTADSRLCPVVRRIVKTKKQERFRDRLCISYSTALENMRKFNFFYLSLTKFRILPLTALTVVELVTLDLRKPIQS